MIVSQSQVPLVVSGGHIPVSGSSYGPSQGVPHIPNYGHPMGHLMELLMDSLMDCNMDKTINPMGTSIKNLLTLPIMAL